MLIGLWTRDERGVVSMWSRHPVRSRAVLVSLVVGFLTQPCAAADSASSSSDAPAFDADSQAGAAQDGALAEVVVTARRKEEQLEKVPVAVQAISQEQLTERKINSEADLEAAVPGLTVRQTSSSNQLSFALRGQSEDAFSYTSPTVLTYVDEFQAGGVTSTAFFDLQSVQVLKGPQGTLFGRNATGGAVLYQTVQPGQQLTGYLRLGAGNYRDKEFEGAITLPIAPAASLRIAAQVQKRDGYQHNLDLSLWENSIDSKNVRGTLLLTPFDGFENSTLYQYGRYLGYSGSLRLAGVYPVGATHNGQPLVDTAALLYPPNNPLVRVAGFNGILDFLSKERQLGFYDVYNDTTDSHSAVARMAVNKTTYTFSNGLIVKNIIGYNRVFSRDQTDVDGSPYQVLNIGQTGGLTAEGYTYDTRQYSEELQASGLALDGKLNYVGGLYYGRDDEGQDIPLAVAADYPVQFQPEPPFRDDFRQQEISKALYFQGTYEIATGLHATAGYRQTWENVTIIHIPGAIPPDSSYALGVPDATTTESKPSWTLGLDYQLTPELLVYVAQRGSFRAGGYNGVSNLPLPSGQHTNDAFLPETTWDVEVGTKFSGYVGSLPARINLALYDQHVKDIQRAVYIGIAAETSNAKAARVSGAEFEAQLDLLRWLQVGFAYAYTDARYTDPAATAVDTSGVLHQLELGPYGDTPRQSGSAFVRIAHELPDSAGQVIARADEYAQSYFYYTNLDATLTPGVKIGGYGLLNMRLEWNDIFASKVSVAAWARNLTNKEYLVGGLGLGAVIGVNSTLPGTPRMYGLEITANF